MSQVEQKTYRRLTNCHSLSTFNKALLFIILHVGQSPMQWYPLSSRKDRDCVRNDNSVWEIVCWHLLYRDICWFRWKIEFYFTSGQKKLLFHEWRSHEWKYIFRFTTSEIKFDLSPKTTNILFVLHFYKELNIKK